MGGACKYCGGAVEWKDKAGRFREFCEACARLVADGRDLRVKYDTDRTPLGEPDRPE